MGTEAKLLRLPVPTEKATCHLTIPRFDHVIALEEDIPSGMAALATEMVRVGEQFDALAQIFDECEEGSYNTGASFIEGHLTFVFQIPRKYVKRLRELGWCAEDLDVPAEGTVEEPDESDA